MSLFSDRTMHCVDWLTGLLPVSTFMYAPAAAMAAGNIGGDTECMGPTWLLPAGGDDNGTLAGEPIVDYPSPGLHVVDTPAEENQWSPDGTMIALDTINDATNTPAPYLLVAHLDGVKPSAPLAPVSSEPGAWAPSPAGYHGPMDLEGAITLPGPKGGSVTIDAAGALGDVAGSWTVTYHGYSTNGTDFYNDSASTSGTALAGTVSSNLTETGADTGDDDIDITFGGVGMTGHASSMLDGHTITGPNVFQMKSTTSDGTSSACPTRWPKAPALQLSVTHPARRSERLTVTASIAGVGPSETETETDTQPVQDATIQIGRRRYRTNGRGTVTVPVAHAERITVSAGQTLTPTSAMLRPRPAKRSKP
jgi:hypothetical protein